jgi:hypothetical protein
LIGSLHRRLYGVLVVLCLLVATYEYVSYRRDQRWIAAFTRNVVPANAGREQQVVALREYVRRNIRFEQAPLGDRPFLRASARETLASGQGYCGEATRAYIAMARTLGISAQRVNLHGTVVSHVVPEVELGPDRWALVDIQDNPNTNPILDSGWKQADEVVGFAGSLFYDFSNINLRRLPLVNHFVRRIRLNSTEFTWLLENPRLIMAVGAALLAVLLIIVWIADHALIRIYSRRLGVGYVGRRSS